MVQEYYQVPDILTASPEELRDIVLTLNRHLIDISTRLGSTTASSPATDIDYITNNYYSTTTVVDAVSLFQNTFYPDPTALDQGAADAVYTTVKNIVDSVGSTENATIVFRHAGGTSPTTYQFDTSESITNNLTIIVEPGAQISLTSGVDIDIYGPFIASKIKVFNLAGSNEVAFLHSSIHEIPVEWFGAIGDNSTDCTAAINATIAAADYSGGADVLLSAGIYRTSGDHEMGGKDNVKIRGANAEATVLRVTSATNHVFKWTSAGRWQKFQDFTIDCSITKTSGAHFYASSQVFRTRWQDLKLKDWYDGIKLDAFEVCWIDNVQIAEPDAAGSAIIAGKTAASAQGANLMITDCFLRGTDGTDGVGGTAVANYGLVIYDADAVFCENTDFGGFVKSDLDITPSTRANNHHFTTSYFDTTKDDACVQIEGAGTKTEIAFIGCWFASAGSETGGSNTANGLSTSGAGAIRGRLTGCIFYNCKGNGADIRSTDTTNLNFTGCEFTTNGTGNQNTYDNDIYIGTSAAKESVKLIGCNFTTAVNGSSIEVAAAAVNYEIRDCNCADAITLNGSTPDAISNTTASNSISVASAATITLPPQHRLVDITGTTGITAINGGWYDRLVTLVFNDNITITDGGTLKMAGNFNATADDTLTLIASAASTWFEVARSVN